MKVLTAAQMREADRRSRDEFGIPSLQLMENAGTRVSEFLIDKIPDLARKKIVVLCGKGNNGGDGLVVARLLKQQGCAPSVFLCADPDAVAGDAAVNLRRWREKRGDLFIVLGEDDWGRARATVSAGEVVVDALLGTGLRGPVEGLLRTVIRDVNSLCADAVVVAVDVPSGLASDEHSSPGPVIQADYTVALAAPKLGEILPPNREFVGKLSVADIGIPVELLEGNAALKIHWLGPDEFRGISLRRDPSAHKGSFGHAFLVAGSRGKTGAAVLAATGALRAGAGLVTVATPQSVLSIVAGFLPEMMTHPLSETEAQSVSMHSLDYDAFFPLLEDKSVLAIGPGLSTHPETMRFVQMVVGRCSLPIILDADGLNAFAGRAAELRARKSAFLAITPHPGEMARVLGTTVGDVQERRLEIALLTANALQAHVVLKGNTTIVASPDGHAFINPTGNPGMATGGTGDVLTGMLAGLTAQFGTADWSRVLSLGVYLHGLAGDLAAADMGEHSLIASDLVRHIPAAFRRLTSPACA
jgi:hydroxyethylthiazole kinase-like uncharacterized protein yjeF